MKGMQRIAVFAVGAAILGAGGFAAFASLQDSTTAKGVTFEGKPMSGLSRGELLAELVAWWEREKHRQLQPKSKYLKIQPEPIDLASAGIRPDWDKTLSDVAFASYFDRLFGRDTRGGEIEIAWTVDQAEFGDLASFVAQHSQTPRPAKVKYVDGKILHESEIPSFTLDTAQLETAMLEALRKGEDEFELPMKKSPQRVTDEMLNAITDVVAEFTTTFNAGQSNRSSNIELACEKLNGIILLPGEELSYNNVVGERSLDKGFKIAPVFVNGRKEMGYGGGACQVSSTLFNAALLANLEIVKRQNHSRPVAYLPIGRDATVDYTSGVDLVIKNNQETPVAIVSAVSKGKITFRVLGKRDPSLSISIITTNHSSWGRGVQYVTDPTLPPGKEKVIDSGASGRSCVTWRIVKKNGVEIKREKVGQSYYGGSPRIVARAPGASVTEPEATPPGDSPPTEPPGGTDNPPTTDGGANEKPANSGGESKPGGIPKPGSKPGGGHYIR